VLAGLLSIVPLLALGCLALTLLFIFRDDLLASLMSRQAEMAAMRTQIEQMKSRELVQEQAYSGRLHELFQRQTQLETRATLVASLAQRAGMAGDVTGEIPRPSSTKAETPSTSATARKNPLLVPSAEVALPAGAAAFAPISPPQPFQTLKPHLDAMEL
jgi:type IV secretory pathway VirJ component